ncbi:MAG: hypothetical protein DRI57_01420 [Deltaproteobacteria bacterium]|nr:MAG: hypothetical protein DRI57_01420 [Deltaproteobacteria bacterium]
MENKSFSIKTIFCDINHILSMPLSIKGVVKLGDKAIYFQVSAYEEPQMNSDRRRCLSAADSSAFIRCL